MYMDLTLITKLVSSVLKSSYSYFHVTDHMLCNRQTEFFGTFTYNFLKKLAKFTLQYPGASTTKQQFRFIFTRAYEISCKMETVKSFLATGIWPTNRMNVGHIYSAHQSLSKFRSYS